MSPPRFSSGSCSATSLPPWSPTSNSAKSGQASACLTACMPAHASSVTRMLRSSGEAAALNVSASLAARPALS
eukprot:548087-Alexandrium_andersonii.AAC.1